MSRVSVCIPVYNNLSQVKRCVGSILEQDYGDYAIFITDDSDNDEIAGWIDQLKGRLRGEGKRDPLRYEKNPERLGPVHNWNRVLAKANGEYVKLFFSDDWLNGPQALGRFVSMLDEHPEASLAFSGSRQTPEEGEPWERCASAEFIARLEEDYRNLFLGNEIGTPSAMICRNTGARFVPESDWASDMFLYFELLKENPRFAYTDKSLVCVGLAADQYTHTFREHDIRKLKDYLRMYERYGLGGSEACRDYLKNAFLLPWYQGPGTAAKYGFKRLPYLKELAAYFIDKKILDYIRHAV